jgi:hypothetical protein
MQINSINSFVQNVPELNTKQNSVPSEAVSLASSIQKSNPDSTFDIHNMSLDEFKSMIKTWHENGTVSSKDAMELSSQAMTLELFGGYSKESKIDMIDTFQNHIGMMKTQHSQGVEYAENALELLKGIDARSKAKIPAYV